MSTAPRTLTATQHVKFTELVRALDDGRTSPDAAAAVAAHYLFPAPTIQALTGLELPRIAELTRRVNNRQVSMH
ncbi:hypothetical protein WILDE_108 [Arthrobacter phage Wilde]|uniref:Uncharacterized protein n=1 Tax=Arthrobacter phage Wilde TaxID=1772323 RepID=A0A0U4KSX2_9CAUD|nr:hypothetical protein WILDE_108 [Arthrobacter phage Wilde]